MDTNTQKAVYSLCKAIPKSSIEKNLHLSFSLSFSREREGVHPSVLELHVHVQQNFYNGGWSDLITERFPHTCNSYPRSCHVEADAQVTLKALCLLHNAPAQLQGRGRRNGWFLKRACKHTSKALTPLIIWLSDVCVTFHIHMYYLLLKTF